MAAAIVMHLNLRCFTRAPTRALRGFARAPTRALRHRLAWCAALLLSGCATAPVASLVDFEDDSGVQPDDAPHESSTSGIATGDRDVSMPPSGRRDSGASEWNESDPDAGFEHHETVDSGSAEPCDFTGTWVAKITAATTWKAGLAIAAGSGTSHIWVKYQMNEDGSFVPGSLVGCGVTIPDFVAGPLLVGEHYGVDFDIPLFDAVPARAVATDPVIRVGGTGSPGDPVTMSDTAMVLGTTLADPVNDSWPASAALVDNDMDGDGKPGVTIPHINDGTRVYLPVDPLRNARADRGYYAARVVLSASGSVASCDEMTGEAVVSRFDTHIVGCRLVNGSECSNLQRGTLDTFRPDHEVDSATYQVVRVADDVSCAVARSTLP